MTDWKTYKLGEITQIIGGGTPKTTVEQYWNGEIGWLTPRDLTGYTNKFISNGERNITEIGLKNSSARLMPKGTVLMTSRAPIGYIAIASKELCTNQGFKSFVVDEKKIKNEFLYYSLKNNIDKIKSLGTGSTFAEVSGSILKDFEISAPDLPTQTAIAQILTSLDDKIELNLQMNQTLEAMAQAIFKEWFVDFKFPNFDGEFENGLPKGWSYKTIKELGKVVTGNTPSSKNPEYFGEVTPFVTPTDFKNFGKLIIGANRYLSNEGTKAMKTRVLPKHSIIVTCIGSDMGKVAINSIECVTNQQINSIIPIDRSFVDYLYYDLVYKYDYLRNIATGGSTMPIINKSRFEEIEILIPNSDILENFQALMESFNSKIEENIRQTQSLTQTRDTLLPKLMSGKIDVMTTLAVAQKQINDAKI